MKKKHETLSVINVVQKPRAVILHSFFFFFFVCMLLCSFTIKVNYSSIKAKTSHQFLLVYLISKFLVSSLQTFLNH